MAALEQLYIETTLACCFLVEESRGPLAVEDVSGAMMGSYQDPIPGRAEELDASRTSPSGPAVSLLLLCISICAYLQESLFPKGVRTV